MFESSIPKKLYTENTMHNTNGLNTGGMIVNNSTQLKIKSKKIGAFVGAPRTYQPLRDECGREIRPVKK